MKLLFHYSLLFNLISISLFPNLSCHGIQEKKWGGLEGFGECPYGTHIYKKNINYQICVKLSNRIFSDILIRNVSGFMIEMAT